MPTLPEVLLHRRKSARASKQHNTSKQKPSASRDEAADGERRKAGGCKRITVSGVLKGTRNRPKLLFCRDFSRRVNAVDQNRAKIIDVCEGRTRCDQPANCSKKSCRIVVRQ